MRHTSLSMSLGVLIEMFYPVCVECTCTAYNAMNLDTDS